MKRIITYGFASIAVGFLALCILVNVYGNLDQAAAADVIVVLGARVLPDGTASSDLASRTAHGVDLFHAGYSPYLICAGGVQGDQFSAAAVSRNLAVRLGVPPERIVLAEDSASTQEDARQVALAMQARQWDTAIVVSHPLHLLRARILFRRKGVSVLTSPTPLQPGEMSLSARAYYTCREALGVIAAFLPPDWVELGVSRFSARIRGARPWGLPTL